MTITLGGSGSSNQLRSDLASTASTAVGDALVGVKSTLSGTVARTQHLVNEETRSAGDWGLTGAYPAGDTAALQAAFDWCASGSHHHLIVPDGDYYVTNLTFSASVANRVTFGATRILGLAAGTGPMLLMNNCVETTWEGQLQVYCGPNHTIGFSMQAIAGGAGASSRNIIDGLTFRDCSIGIAHGAYDNDRQNSETTYLNCNFFGCPQPVYGGGSNTGASFIGCNITSDNNSALPGPPTVISFNVEGGFWYITGGSVTQSNVASGGCFAFNVGPSKGATTNDYGILKVTNAHIESVGQMLRVHNDRTLAAASSAASSIAFQNCGGYFGMGSTAVLSVVSTNNPNCIFAGKIVFGNGCDFYRGTTGTDAHIYSNTTTTFDIDGTPFGTGFKQGLSGISPAYMGKPRLRGETIVNQQKSTTSIASAANTVVQMSEAVVTVDSTYGNAVYSSGVFTAGQDMKSVMISVGVALASAAANSIFWVEKTGSIVGWLTIRTGNQLHTGMVLLPTVAAGDTIRVVGVTASGGAISLDGSTNNYFRLTAVS